MAIILVFAEWWFIYIACASTVWWSARSRWRGLFNIHLIFHCKFWILYCHLRPSFPCWMTFELWCLFSNSWLWSCTIVHSLSFQSEDSYMMQPWFALWFSTILIVWNLNSEICDWSLFTFILLSLLEVLLPQKFCRPTLVKYISDYWKLSFCIKANPGAL